MQHGDIWRGLDLIARRHGLSTSGLAKLAGLDATAFNKSKRSRKDGRPRWPSTESVSRALDAVGVDFSEFAGLVSERHGLMVPRFRKSDEALSHFINKTGLGSDPSHAHMQIPGDETENAWLVFEVGEEDLSCLYAPGDLLIVSRLAPLRVGDRVIAKPVSSDVTAGTLVAYTETRVELRLGPDPDPSLVLRRSGLDWIARILWVSQ